MKDIHVSLEMTSMSILWIPTAISMNFISKWEAKSEDKNLAHGDLEFDIVHKGKKPEKLLLKGIVSVNLDDEERRSLALEIKRQIHEKVRYMADTAYKELQTQSIGIW
jgi:hypothetical protein